MRSRRFLTVAVERLSMDADFAGFSALAADRIDGLPKTTALIPGFMLE